MEGLERRGEELTPGSPSSKCNTVFSKEPQYIADAMAAKVPSSMGFSVTHTVIIRQENVQVFFFFLRPVVTVAAKSLNRYFLLL